MESALFRVMALTVAQKLVRDHLAAGDSLPRAGDEVALEIDQTLTQDATGTLVMLELEAMELPRVRTEVSAQYVDHNLLQEDHKNADDHLFLAGSCQRFGIWFSGPGNGVSHPVHMQHFGRPGASMLGSDSHTCAAGSLGMLSIGAGGIEVAAAMAGQPYHVSMPEIWGIELVGEMPAWVSAKDVILEMLRRHGVSGGVGRIIEYHGDGLRSLSAMDRHVIANMGAELGATTTVFPSDERTREFLADCGREDCWRELVADDGAHYDARDRLDLAALEPLIARPSSPGNVVPVVEVAGQPIYQSYIGSSANPGYRDFAVAAVVVGEAGAIAEQVSLDINPSSRRVFEDLTRDGHLGALIAAGARIHQAGCNGCIGMGQAPATGRNSLRTVPRNFPGRSGTVEDAVWLCSPETAAASAVRGVITDPRDLGRELGMERGPGRRVEPGSRRARMPVLVGPVEPPPEREAAKVEPPHGPNIAPLPELDELPDEIEVEVILSVGDDISTDEILPAGARVLPLRSNLPAIAEFCFAHLHDDYAGAARRAGQHAIAGGANYGQGSSREHAAFAPRYLGLRVVVAKSFARIHFENLVAYGVLPLVSEHASEIDTGSTLVVRGLHNALEEGAQSIDVEVGGRRLEAELRLSERQRRILRGGGMINWLREHAEHAPRGAK